MSTEYKNRFLSVVALVAAMAVSLQAADVVYQSDFTGTNLASAGLATTPGTLGTWTLNTVNDRVEGTGSSNSRVNLYTTNSWQNDRGFTLDVTFTAGGSIVRYDFGLVDAAYTISSSSAWLTSALAGAYGVGFSTTIGTTDGLFFNNGSSVTTNSTDQGNITTGVEQTMSITVTSNSWSYSLNGAAATTGSHTFDTSRSYRFTAHAQRVHETKYFHNITITAIPPGGTVIVVK